MRLNYRLTFLVCTLRIIMIGAYHICRKASFVVYIRLAARHRAPDEIISQFSLVRLSLHKPYKKFIMRRIVIFRLGYRKHVFKTVCQADTVIICLRQAVSCTIQGNRSIGNTPQKSASRISFFYIRVYSVRKLMTVQELHSVPCLTIDTIILTTDMICYAGFCHKVSLISTVYEIRCGNRHGFSIFCSRSNGNYPCPLFLNIFQHISFHHRNVGMVEI